nr:MAG TPA: hypothetical protein [Caudoviricetes sp.]
MHLFTAVKHTPCFKAGGVTPRNREPHKANLMPNCR